MGKCKNKKCNNNGCGEVDKPYDDWKILGINYSGMMRICKVLLVLAIFIISSIQWGATGDVMWQCIWSLSLIKLTELK